MQKILIIVESPNKIKKISSILGNGYIIGASVGHIIDLDPKCMSIDIENNFKPNYVVCQGKAKVIKDLKLKAKDVSDIYIATDMDREGEMIGWCVEKELKLKNAKRIVFTSITKKDLMHAIKNPTTLDINLINAQKTRRIMDRLLGYEISPLLHDYMNQRNLSAGRVQSVVVKIIIDKEEEIENFNKTNDGSFFKINGIFNPDKTSDKIKAVMNDKNKKSATKFKNEKDAKKILNLCIDSKFQVCDIKNSKSKRNPSPPFTTSTLQQDANKKLNFSSKKTMSTAQRLYEEGYITYMRTDSVNLSDEALENIKKYVLKKYGTEYYNLNKFKGKKNNTQEAHEAVRPTKINLPNLTDKESSSKIGSDEKKLYSLIWKRTVASQMKPAIFDVRNISIDISKDIEHVFAASFEKVFFLGFLKVYNNVEGLEDKKDDIIDIKKKHIMIAEELCSTEEYKRPPFRYDQGSLVKKMDPDNLNIGRPATYASIIEKIMQRNYVKICDNDGEEKECKILKWKKGSDIKKITKKIIIGQDKNKFSPTVLGKKINNYLIEHFPNIMDYKYTANMEDQLDDIADGKKKPDQVLKLFYNDFHPKVIDLRKKKNTIDDNCSRILGEDDNGNQIIATIKKYGPVLQKICDPKPIYAPIKEPLKLETITLKDAIKIFEYPKILGQYKNSNILIKKGEYGIYIEHGKTRKSIENENIQLEEAIKLIVENKKKVFKSDTYIYTICTGPYGAYIRMNKKNTKKTYNVSIPKNKDITKLKLKDVELIASNFFDNKKANYNNKKKVSPNKKKVSLNKKL